VLSHFPSNHVSNDSAVVALLSNQLAISLQASHFSVPLKLPLSVVFSDASVVVVPLDRKFDTVDLSMPEGVGVGVPSPSSIESVGCPGGVGDGCRPGGPSGPFEPDPDPGPFEDLELGPFELDPNPGPGLFESGPNPGPGLFESGPNPGLGLFESGPNPGPALFESGPNSGPGPFESGAEPDSSGPSVASVSLLL